MELPAEMPLKWPGQIIVFGWKSLAGEFLELAHHPASSPREQAPGKEQEEKLTTQGGFGMCCFQQ